MNYNDISNDELNNMIKNILSENDTISQDTYVNEKADQFIKSLQNMVEDKDKALENYRKIC